jgi:hypothetical protein
LFVISCVVSFVLLCYVFFVAPTPPTAGGVGGRGTEA